MSGGRTTIPEWELKRLRAITDGPTVQQREAALLDYLTERERRKRYARVRNARDRQRRTLVGAHIPREEAELVSWLADKEDLSTTAFVKLALRQAMERSDTSCANPNPPPAGARPPCCGEPPLSFFTV